MKKNILISLLFLACITSIWAVWEGNGGIGSSSEFPAKGLFVRSDMFPKHTLLEITNLEKNQTSRAIVIGPSGIPGLLISISPDLGNKLQIPYGKVVRVRVLTPSPVQEIGDDGLGIFTSNLESQDLDNNPSMMVANNTEPEEVIQPSIETAPTPSQYSIEKNSAKTTDKTNKNNSSEYVFYDDVKEKPVKKEIIKDKAIDNKPIVKKEAKAVEKDDEKEYVFYDELESEPVKEIPVKAESQPEPEIKEEPKEEAIVEVEPITEPEPIVETETVVKAEPVLEPEPIAETEKEPVIEPDLVAENKAMPDTESVAEPEPIADPSPIVQEKAVAEIEPIAEQKPEAPVEVKSEIYLEPTNMRPPELVDTTEPQTVPGIKSQKKESNIEQELSVATAPKLGKEPKDDKTSDKKEVTDAPELEEEPKKAKTNNNEEVQNAPEMQDAPKKETNNATEDSAVADAPEMQEAPKQESNSQDENPVEESPVIEEDPIVEDAEAVEEEPIEEKPELVEKVQPVEEKPIVEEPETVEEITPVKKEPIQEEAKTIEEIEPVEEEIIEEKPKTVEEIEPIEEEPIEVEPETVEEITPVENEAIEEEPEEIYIVQAPKEEPEIEILTEEKIQKDKLYVQIIVYNKKKQAERIINKYNKRYPMLLQEKQGKKAMQYIVFIGPLKQEETGAISEYFRSLGFTGAFMKKFK